MNNSDYKEWLVSLKSQIKRNQIKAATSVNSQLMYLYWELGRQIVEKQEQAKWGSGFIDKLSKDLRKEFPEMKGFSKVNLLYMRRFYLFYLPLFEENIIVQQYAEQYDNEKIQQLAEQLQPINRFKVRDDHRPEFEKIFLLPWWHNVKIIEQSKSMLEALFYVNKTIENHWSRAVLEYHIETNLYKTQGKSINNFKITLPEPESDLANAIMKSHYNFEFLRLAEKVKETDLEKALVNRMAEFLTELGVGFAYLGRQYPIKYRDSEYRLDLLFYHIKLKCYVVIELKSKEFKPGYLGDLNYYINLVDELVKDDTDNQTIGILLCKHKDNFKVEFALKGITSPIGVSSYKYTELDSKIKALLPSAEVLQNELLSIEKSLLSEED